MVLLTTMFVIIDLPAWSVTIITQELKYMHLCPWRRNIINLQQEINEYKRLHRSTCFPSWNVRGNLNSRRSVSSSECQSERIKTAFNIQRNQATLTFVMMHTFSVVCTKALCTAFCSRVKKRGKKKKGRRKENILKTLLTTTDLVVTFNTQSAPFYTIPPSTPTTTLPPQHPLKKTIKKLTLMGRGPATKDRPNMRVTLPLSVISVAERTLVG